MYNRTNEQHILPSKLIFDTSTNSVLLYHKFHTVAYLNDAIGSMVSVFHKEFPTKTPKIVIKMFPFEDEHKKTEMERNQFKLTYGKNVTVKIDLNPKVEEVVYNVKSQNKLLSEYDMRRPKIKKHASKMIPLSQVKVNYVSVSQETEYVINHPNIEGFISENPYQELVDVYQITNPIDVINDIVAENKKIQEKHKKAMLQIEVERYRLLKLSFDEIIEEHKKLMKDHPECSKKPMTVYNKFFPNMTNKLNKEVQTINDEINSADEKIQTKQDMNRGNEQDTSISNKLLGNVNSENKAEGGPDINHKEQLKLIESLKRDNNAQARTIIKLNEEKDHFMEKLKHIRMIINMRFNVDIMDIM